jgi:hypothetical protein
MFLSLLQLGWDEAMAGMLNVSMLFGNLVWDKFIMRHTLHTYVSKWISLIILPQIEPTSAVLEKRVDELMILLKQRETRYIHGQRKKYYTKKK